MPAQSLDGRAGGAKTEQYSLRPRLDIATRDRIFNALFATSFLLSPFLLLRPWTVLVVIHIVLPWIGSS